MFYYFTQPTVSSPVRMELLNLTDGCGQNFGYILYRADITNGSHELEFANRPDDRTQVFKSHRCRVFSRRFQTINAPYRVLTLEHNAIPVLHFRTHMIIKRLFLKIISIVILLVMHNLYS